MPETLHVAIVDDHPLFREGVAHTLAAQPDIEIVGEGESAADAIRIAAERIPDVMLLDVSMPGGGLSAVREIAAAFPVIKLVMLTVSEDEDDVTAALRAGARGIRAERRCRPRARPHHAGGGIRRGLCHAIPRG